MNAAISDGATTGPREVLVALVYDDARKAHAPVNSSRARRPKMHAHRAVAVLLLVGAFVPLPRASAAELTGGWQGVGEINGQPAEFAVTFSERGYMLFNYQTNGGEVRTVELDQPLQFQYVPPGGGVRTMRVESVDQRSAAISYVFSSSFERLRGGYLEQNYTSEEHEYLASLGRTQQPRGQSRRILSWGSKRTRRWPGEC